MLCLYHTHPALDDPDGIKGVVVPDWAKKMEEGKLDYRVFQL